MIAVPATTLLGASLPPPTLLLSCSQDQDGRVSVVEVNKAWTPPDEPFLTMLVALLERGSRPYRHVSPMGVPVPCACDPLPFLCPRRIEAAPWTCTCRRWALGGFGAPAPAPLPIHPPPHYPCSSHDPSNLPPPLASWRGYEREQEAAFGAVVGQVMGNPAGSHLFVVTGVTGAGVSAFTVVLGHRLHAAGLFPGGIGSCPQVFPDYPLTLRGGGCGCVWGGAGGALVPFVWRALCFPAHRVQP